METPVRAEGVESTVGFNGDSDRPGLTDGFDAGYEYGKSGDALHPGLSETRNKLDQYISKLREDNYKDYEYEDDFRDGFLRGFIEGWRSVHPGVDPYEDIQNSEDGLNFLDTVTEFFAYLYDKVSSFISLFW